MSNENTTAYKRSQEAEAAEALHHDNPDADIDGPTDEELAVIAAELEVDFE